MQTITLCPDYISCDLKVSPKKTKKGIYYSLSYYIGLNKKSKCGFFSEDELNCIIEEINKEKNSFNDVFIINKSELTLDIITHFRYVEPFIIFQYQNVLIEPYILGLWLGDGDSCRPGLTNIDIPIINAWKNYALEIGYNVSTSNEKPRVKAAIEGETNTIMSYHIVKPLKNENKSNKGLSGNYRFNKFKTNLKNYNLLDNKHIPDEYLQNSEEVRLKLLAGLIDTDGSLSKGRYEITQKNKQLSDNIVSLCRSLGFYTRIKKENKGCMYKGEYKVGTYYRICISLNQFSKEVPVLLERKKWKYDITKKNICNPFIDIDGNILCRTDTTTKWCEDMKIKLYSIIEKIKEMQPNRQIDWNIVKQFDERFQNISNRALDTMYFKTLLIKKEEYENKKINVSITEYDLIDIEWRKSYELIKDRLEQNIPINKSNDTKLYNWLYKSTSLDVKLTPLQITLWEDLINKQRIIMNDIETNDWKIKYDELIVYIQNNNKTPIEGTILGNWLKLQKKNYKKKCGILCIDPDKIKLWQILLDTFGKIITITNTAKSIKVLFPNKETKIFDMQIDAIREIGLGLTKGIILTRIKNKKDFKGHYFEIV